MAINHLCDRNLRLFLQSIKDRDIIALRDGSRSQGVIANLLERIVPMLPRKVINKVCYSIREIKYRFRLAAGMARADQQTGSALLN